MSYTFPPSPLHPSSRLPVIIRRYAKNSSQNGADDRVGAEVSSGRRPGLALSHFPTDFLHLFARLLVLSSSDVVVASETKRSKRGDLILW